MKAYTEEQASMITDYLAAAGSSRNVSNISVMLKISYKDTKPILIALCDEGLIHRCEYGNESYMLGRLEVKVYDPVTRPPLKVDHYRIELYRELAEARAATPSIG